MRIYRILCIQKEKWLRAEPNKLTFKCKKDNKMQMQTDIYYFPIKY